MTPQRSNNRIVALVLAVLSVGALGYAAMSKRWLYNPRTVDTGAEIGFGPRGMFMCEEEGCQAMSNSELVALFKDIVAGAEQRAAADPNNPTLSATAAKAREMARASAAFSPFGWITFVAIAIAALSLLVAAVLVALKKRILLPVMPTTTALLGCMIGLITGCVFVAVKPGPTGFVGVNFGFWAFGGGVIAGIASCLMLNKLMRPHDPDLLDDAMNPEDFPS
ncbi:MAG: hypothetical protein KIT31_07380 [Deltaproteobacteria bacterium]|nr:hypothetical protein [Deltaproteobacteria bacterium]